MSGPEKIDPQLVAAELSDWVTSSYPGVRVRIAGPQPGWAEILIEADPPGWVWFKIAMNADGSVYWLAPQDEVFDFVAVDDAHAVAEIMRVMDMYIRHGLVRIRRYRWLGPLSPSYVGLPVDTAAGPYLRRGSVVEVLAEPWRPR